MFPKLLIFINDNVIYVKKGNGEIISQKLSSLKNDNMTNKQKFDHEFFEWMKKNKIKMPLFGRKIQFLKTNNQNEINIENFKTVFKEYFNKIEIKELEEKLKPSKDEAILNITDYYVDFYYKTNKIRIDIAIFKNNIIKTISHFITTIYRPKKILLIGNDNNIPDVSQSIAKKFDIKVSFPENYYFYALEYPFETK